MVAQSHRPRLGTLPLQETDVTAWPWVILLALYGILRALIDERRAT